MENLLKSAFSLFKEKGFNETSVSDITENAGVAKGTFYLYFKDKFDILNSIAQRKAHEIFEDAYNKMSLCGFRSFEDKLIFIVNSILDYYGENHSVMQLIDRNLGRGIFHDIIKEIPRDNPDSNVASFMREAADEYRDCSKMLYLVFELVSSSCLNVILHDDPFTLEELKPALFSSIRNILAGFRRTSSLQTL
ncbi:MAG: TetR/AcrR family transcriptional regulator [Oscillospiraceae bacterium]